MYYEENRSLEEEDMGYDTPLYKITIYDKTFLIALGKERKLIQKKNTFYFPVYLMNKMNVQAQIGAFQFESSKETTEQRIKTYLDTSGDLDVNRLGDIVLYSFATYVYFNDIQVGITPASLSELEAKYIQEKATTLAEGEEEEVSERPKKPFELGEEDFNQPVSLKKAHVILKTGVFEINKSMKPLATLHEETKEDAEKIKEEYSERKSAKWVEKYMSNGHYDIVETNNNGDCFFDTVRVAYEQVGHITTIKKLRAIVANAATDEMFMEYRELYLSIAGEIEDVDKQLRKLVVENKGLKERLKHIPTSEKAKRSEIISIANRVKKQHEDLKEKQVTNKDNLQEFAFMKGVDSMEKFREIIQTPVYWADNWAIDVLERELNMKTIIFSEEDYDQNDENNVIRCSITSVSDSRESFEPSFYVMTTYSGKHYRLITYKNKRIFTFNEIPYDVKIMVVIKCMERNSGIFSQIQDFKNLKSRMGIAEEEPEDESSADTSDSHLSLDTTTVFTFYNKANGTAKPGKASNEKINRDKLNEYADLGLKRNHDWRKKLDDDWSTIFTVDSKKWKSVEHYYQAAKFKKHNPHFYKMFSLDDTNSDIAKDVELAKAAGSQKGVFKKGKKQVQLRPEDIRIDSDFYGNRRFEERENALYAKFSQNEDLKDILLATKNAVLKQYVPKQATTEDTLLMKVREKLQVEN
jgi:predicted NAD-dependent protein-ADP-ribosyltransferase YbiA (DUF1768 family)